MTYATRDDLEKRYGADEIAQRESALVAGSVDQFLVDADSMINGYLVGRYSLPLTIVPPVLPQMACQIARYNLLGDSATERARNDYKDAIAWLKDVQSGRVLLENALPVPGNTPDAMVVYLSSPAVFKRAGRP